ncbi:hypothetical protein [Ornithinimicrobium sp. W1665]|uniref:hypothetical protein n=1 Tax=Ornithinimicrobium sp. W1665 TaxID=3416666 RepID=UPI003D6B19B2
MVEGAICASDRPVRTAARVVAAEDNNATDPASRPISDNTSRNRTSTGSPDPEAVGSSMVGVSEDGLVGTVEVVGESVAVPEGPSLSPGERRPA